VKRQSSRAQYVVRMHRVQAYIDAHLDEALDLHTLAEVAHFSAFHFHRLFSAWMGESLGDYLRRRRVEVGAMRLLSQPRLRVLDAALAVGFGSAEAFTRAFRVRFGTAPTAWRATQRQSRKDSNRSQVMSPDLTQHPVNVVANQNPDHTMHVEVIDRQPVTIAYLRHLGPYGEPVARFWQEQYVPWARLNKLGPGHARYGISHDDPGVAAPEQCRYDACAEVAASFAPQGKAIKTTLPGGKYAVLAFSGTVAQVGEAWAALLRDWLPASGLQLDARPCFEYYPMGAGFDPVTGTFDCEICIPVMPL